jgi:hypothetical protein
MHIPHGMHGEWKGKTKQASKGGKKSKTEQDRVMHGGLALTMVWYISFPGITTYVSSAYHKGR